MANSTNIIADLRTVALAAPTAASITDSNAAAGPITDLPGMANVAVIEAEGLKRKLQAILAAADAGDTNYYTTINNVIGTMGP